MSSNIQIPILTDTHIRSATPTSNYVTNTAVPVGNTSGNTFRSFIKPDYTKIILPSGVSIVGGGLILTAYSEASTNTRTLYAHRILQDVNFSQLTWNIFSTGNNWSTAGCKDSTNDYDGAIILGSVSVPDNISAGETVTIPLNGTEMLKFVNEDYANYGIVLFVDTESSDLVYYSSMEYASQGYRPIFYITINKDYTSQYPSTHNDTYVKATTKYSTSFWPYFATDPSVSLVGGNANTTWISANGTYTNQRFHIDLGESKVIRRFYYENYHNSGGNTNLGVKDFTLWGSNSSEAFADLDYSHDTDWTQLTTTVSQFEEHDAENLSDPKYVFVTNVTAYRYYAFKFANNWAGSTYIGLKRIELQTEDGWSPDGTPTYVPGVIWF